MKTLAIILLAFLTIGCQKDELPPEKEATEEPTPEEPGKDADDEEQPDNSPDYRIDFEIFGQPETIVTTIFRAIEGQDKTTTETYTPTEGQKTSFSIAIDDELYNEVNIIVEFAVKQMTWIEHKTYYGDHYEGGESGYSNWGKNITETF